MVGGLTVLITFQILFYVIYSVIELRKRIKKLSRVTSCLQRKFSNALYAQVSIPMIVYLFPMFYVFFTWTFDVFSQICNNLVFIFIALHGLLSTITMFIVHKPYRECLKLIIPRCPKWRKRSRVASVRDLHLSVII